jgi:hypothetical protein
MRNVSDKSCRENKNTHLMFNNFFFLNRAVYEIMWKNIVERDRPQVKIQHGTCALHARLRGLQPHTLKICNTYCFSIATGCTRATMLRYTCMYTACLVGFLLWHDCWSQTVIVIMFNAWVGPQLDFVRGMKLSGSPLLISFVSRTTQSYNLCKFSEIYFMN